MCDDTAHLHCSLSVVHCGTTTSWVVAHCVTWCQLGRTPITPKIYLTYTASLANLSQAETLNDKLLPKKGRCSTEILAIAGRPCWLQQHIDSSIRQFAIWTSAIKFAPATPISNLCWFGLCFMRHDRSITTSALQWIDDCCHAVSTSNHQHVSSFAQSMALLWCWGMWHAHNQFGFGLQSCGSAVIAHLLLSCVVITALLHWLYHDTAIYEVFYPSGKNFKKHTCWACLPNPGWLVMLAIDLAFHLF